MASKDIGPQEETSARKAQKPEAAKTDRRRETVRRSLKTAGGYEAQSRALSPRTTPSAEEIQATAQAGVAGGGTALPHRDRIQASFGIHDLTGVQAHVGGPAAEAAETFGAEAYATGSQVAFTGQPDLHTAAHEAAHVVQQRAGVSLKGGVGTPGDAYEREADEVADAVVAGRSAQGILSRAAPAKGTQTQAVQPHAVQFIGKRLDQPLSPSDPQPAFGETPGVQRRYSPEQYIEMWEKEQGRKMTPQERETINRGCIGITATNLAGGGNPLDFAEGVYGTFDQAHQKMVEKNRLLDEMARKGQNVGPAQYNDPKRAAEDPMKVLQSTKEKFCKGYLDFDRIVFCIALAHNYDPARVAIAYAGGGGGAG